MAILFSHSWQLFHLARISHFRGRGCPLWYRKSSGKSLTSRIRHKIRWNRVKNTNSVAIFPIVLRLEVGVFSSSTHRGHYVLSPSVALFSLSKLYNSPPSIHQMETKFETSNYLRLQSQERINPQIQEKLENFIDLEVHLLFLIHWLNKGTKMSLQVRSEHSSLRLPCFDCDWKLAVDWRRDGDESRADSLTQVHRTVLPPVGHWAKNCVRNLIYLLFLWNTKRPIIRCNYCGYQ